MATPERSRILLVVDACDALDAAIAESLTTLAARLGAELEGLFVEDEALLRAAELPFVSEVHASGEERDFDADSVRRRSRDLCRELERLLARAAGAREVALRFSTRAGSRLLTACTVAEACDLFLAGRPSRIARGMRGAGAFARVGMVVAGPGHAARALSVIRALARNGHTREVVLVCQGRPPADVLDALAGERLRVYVQAATLADPRELLDEVRAQAADLLVAPRSLLLPAAAPALESFPASVLLLQEPP